MVPDPDVVPDPDTSVSVLVSVVLASSVLVSLPVVPDWELPEPEDEPSVEEPVPYVDVVSDCVCSWSEVDVPDCGWV